MLIVALIAIPLLVLLAALFIAGRKTQFETAPRAGSPERVFWLMPMPGLWARLARAVSDTPRDLSVGVLSYLRHALFPDRMADWFWLRTARLAGDSFAHPIETLAGIVAPDNTGFKKRRWFVPVLATSAAAHGALIVYLVYLAFFSAFAHVQVVNKAYRKFDPNALLDKLYYPPQILQMAPRGNSMSLDEIRARAEKRKQEIALAKEKAEKERKARGGQACGAEQACAACQVWRNQRSANQGHGGQAVRVVSSRRTRCPRHEDVDDGWIQSRA